MATLYGSVRYWLVDHPNITHFEWKPGQTPGASPRFVSTAVAAYLSATLLLYRFPVLPTLPSVALRLATAAHDIILCLLSLLMAVGTTLSILHQTPPDNLSWCLCFPGGGETARRGPTFFWAYVFYLSKFVEFVDTLLILLSGSRGRRRLSFLHVYHHAVVPAMSYMWLAAPHSTFPIGVTANSSVHVVMYAYYLAAALGFRPRWKRFVTNCQITQFLFAYPLLGLNLYLHFTGSAGCTGIWTWIFNFVFGSSLLALFMNFHLRNYARKRKQG